MCVSGQWWARKMGPVYKDKAEKERSGIPDSIPKALRFPLRDSAEL